MLALDQAFLVSQMPMQFIQGGLAGQFYTNLWPQKRFHSSSNLWRTSCINIKLWSFKGFIYIFSTGSVISRICMVSYGFYCFAVTNSAPKEFDPRAISYVIAAALGAAILPELVKISSVALSNPFLGLSL